MKFSFNWRYLLPVVLFAIFAYAVLLGMYSDMLFTAQDRNAFFLTSDFFSQSVSTPFGLMSWAGGYLTQYFYHPAFGTTLLVLLWMLVYAVSASVFRLSAKGEAWLLLPLGCLLASITDVGYWVYSLMLPGYWFSQTLAYLVLLLMLKGAHLTPSRWRLLWYVAALALYPWLGWMVYLFAACLCLSHCMRSSEGSNTSLTEARWLHVVLMLCVALSPYVWRALTFGHLPMRSLWMAGFPFFENNTSHTFRTSFPFFLLIGLTLWFSAFSLRQSCFMESRWAKRLKLNAISVSVLAMLLCVGVFWKTKFDDYNYQAEMRMNRLVMDEDWTGAIEEASKTMTPSRSMVMLRNVALLNTGNLGNSAFAMGGSGVEIYNPDSMQINIMQIAAPMVYFNHGKMLYALRWCMEFGVVYGFCPYYLKTMTRVAQVKGETQLVQRYQRMLGSTAYYADWRPKPISEMLKQLESLFLDVIDSDNNDAERYLIENFSMAQGSGNPYVQELNLFYSMIYRDPQLFWPAFHAYASRTDGKNLPIHYQEAYLEFMVKYPAKLPYTVEINPSVSSRYESFKTCLQNAANYCQGNNDQIADMLHDEWQGTYWYYLYFGRKTY